MKTNKIEGGDECEPRKYVPLAGRGNSYARVYDSGIASAEGTPTPDDYPKNLFPPVCDSVVATGKRFKKGVVAEMPEYVNDMGTAAA